MAINWGKVLSTGLDIAGALLGGNDGGGGQQGAAPQAPGMQVGSDAALYGERNGYVPPGMGGQGPGCRFEMPWGSGLSSAQLMQQPQLAPEAAPPTMRSADPYAVPGAPFPIAQPGLNQGPANYAGLPFQPPAMMPAPFPIAQPGNYGPANYAGLPFRPPASDPHAAPPTMRSPSPYGGMYS